MSENEAWTPVPKNAKMQLKHILDPYKGGQFSREMSRQELDDWMDGNAPTMPNLMLEMFSIAHQLATTDGTNAPTRTTEEFTPHVARSFQITMTPQGLRRGLNLGEMITAANRAANIYTRVIADMNDVRIALTWRCPVEDWDFLSLTLVNVLDKVKRQATNWTHNDVLVDFRSASWTNLATTGRAYQVQPERVEIASYLTTAEELPAMTRSTELLAVECLDQLGCWSEFNKIVVAAMAEEQDWIDLHGMKSWFRNVPLPFQLRLSMITVIVKTTGQMRNTSISTLSVGIRSRTGSGEIITRALHRRSSMPSGATCNARVKLGVHELPR
jgi:hypothetical protein